MNRLTNQMVPLNHLWPDSEAIEDWLTTAAGNEERLKRFAAVLESKRKRASTNHILRVAVNHLTARPKTDIEALSRESGVSRQALARMFQKNVGVSPKLLARMIRLQHVLKVIESAPDAMLPWSAIAQHAGYYDQSHLISEFRDMVGVAPQHFVISERGKCWV